MIINHLKAKYNDLELEIDLDDSILDGKYKEVVLNKNYITVSIDHVDIPIEDIKYLLDHCEVDHYVAWEYLASYGEESEYYLDIVSKKYI
jgi:hypothetical protein